MANGEQRWHFDNENKKRRQVMLYGQRVTFIGFLDYSFNRARVWNKYGQQLTCDIDELSEIPRKEELQ